MDDEGLRQFYAELQALVQRHALESDINITEAIGALELVKAWLIEQAQKPEEYI